MGGAGGPTALEGGAVSNTLDEPCLGRLWCMTGSVFSVVFLVRSVRVVLIGFIVV